MNNSPVQNFWQLVSGNADQLLSLVDEESELAHELLEEVQHQLSDIDPHLTVFCARDESGTGIELVFAEFCLTDCLLSEFSKKSLQAHANA